LICLLANYSTFNRHSVNFDLFVPMEKIIEQTLLRIRQYTIASSWDRELKFVRLKPHPKGAI
jgi:hypothetical protein